MKKLVLVLAVFAALLALSAPAMAWPSAHIPWWQPARTFTAAGPVTGVDPTTGALTINVNIASRGAAPYLDQDLTVTVGASTQLLEARGITFRQIALAAIQPGQHARVTGVIVRAVPGSPSFVAQRVVIRNIVTKDNLTWFACRGPVTAVDSADGLITVHLNRVTRALWDNVATNFTLHVAPSARILTWVGGSPVVLPLGSVMAGDTVMAQGPIDRSIPMSPVFTVNWMRVWHKTAK